MEETFGRLKCYLICGLLLLLIIGNVISINVESHENGPTDVIDDTLKDSMKEKEIALSSSYFIQNKGQIESKEIQFYSRGGNIFFTPDGVLYRFSEMELIDEDGSGHDPLNGYMKETASGYHEWGVVLKYSFIGSNNVFPEGRDQCTWNTNYFKGSDPEKWYTEVPNFKEIMYSDLWDGIDLVYRLKEGSIKYDLIIHPGADPSDIRIHIDGANGLSINLQDDLVIGTDYWDIIDSGLISHYGDGLGELIPCRFELLNECEYKVSLGTFDRSRNVVIDPIINYSTFIGGPSLEYGYGIAIDTSGNAYITGYTLDGTTDYPTTPGAFNMTHNGGSDLFVTKLNSAGSSLVYSTFIGGSTADYGRSIAIDTSGNAYITGNTEDGEIDYPTTLGAYDTTHNGGSDVFITKLNPSGSSLVYSTFIGGPTDERGYGIAIDSSGDAYVTGNTYDTWGYPTHFPTTLVAYDTTHNGDYDVFVTKLNSTGSSLVYSTFIGGSSRESGRGIVIDTNENAYITGYTLDGTTGYPTTAGAFNTTHNGGSDVFVTKLNSAGSSLVYSTFIGGSTDDSGNGIAIDTSENAYITGNTEDGEIDFPTTLGAYDTTHNGRNDVFVTKLNSTGSSLGYSTLIGGSDYDYGYGIAIDPSGNAYITGYTGDGQPNFPTTIGAYETEHNGYFDVFVTRLNSIGSSLVYSTFIGSPSGDYGYNIAIDTSGNGYITGSTMEGTNGYPTTLGAYDTKHNGRYDVFVSKIDLTGLPGIPQNLSAVVGDSFVELSWNPPEEDGGAPIIEYEIYRRNKTGLLSSIAFTGENTTFNDTSVVNGNRYYYAILAHNRVGPGKLSNEVFVIPVTIPTPPRNVDAQYGNNYVNLTWISPENDGGTMLTGFRLHKFEGGSSDPEIFNIDPYVNTYTDEEVDNGINYRYYLTAFNTVGESPPSIEVNATPKSRPSSVLNFQISSGPGFIILHWSPPEYNGGSPVTNYTIFRAVGSSNLDTYVTLSSHQLQFNDTSVENGVVHRYKIIALNSEGASDPTEEISATPFGHPSAPRNLEVKVYSDSVKLSWEMPLKDGGTTILGFRIYRSDKDEIWDNIKEVEAFDLSFADNMIINGKTYSYRITAFNAVGESDPTETVNATPLGKPGSPMNFNVKAGDDYVQLSWEMPWEQVGTPVTEFKIFRSDSSNEMAFYSRVAASELSYIDGLVKNGETYYYKVAAVNIIGVGPFTEIKSAKPVGQPSPPSNIQIVAGDGYVNISWSPPLNDGGDHISHVTLYRGIDRNSTVSIYSSANLKGLFRDTTVENGVTYYYSMTASNTLGESINSVPILKMPYGNPSIPLNVKVRSGTGSIKVTWQVPEDNGGLEIIGYHIYRTFNDGSRVLMGEVEPNTFEFVDRNVVSGPKYLYQVAAVNGKVEGSLSRPVEGSVKDSIGRGPVIVAVALIIILLIFNSIIVFILISRRKRNLHSSPTKGMMSLGLSDQENCIQPKNIPIKKMTCTPIQDSPPIEGDP